MRLGDYVKMSTANPTGWRPWNSRLSGLACPAPVLRQQGLSAFYIENPFPLPTTGRGRLLLQPGVNARPTVSGGMGDDGSSSIFGISFDPTLMIAGLGILMVALYLSGRSSTPKRRKRKKKPGRMRRAASAAYKALAVVP